MKLKKWQVNFSMQKYVSAFRIYYIRLFCTYRLFSQYSLSFVKLSFKIRIYILYICIMFIANILRIIIQSQYPMGLMVMTNFISWIPMAYLCIINLYSGAILALDNFNKTRGPWDGGEQIFKHTHGHHITLKAHCRVSQSWHY